MLFVVLLLERIQCQDSFILIIIDVVALLLCLPLSMWFCVS